MKKIIYDGTEEAIYYEKLANGLEVYMYPNNYAKNFYLTMNVKFGSVDVKFKLDGEKKFSDIPQGTAHFLEHLMFEGEDHSAFEDFADLGSSVNAYTSYDITCYEVIASNHFKENLTTLVNFVQTPVFKSQAISREKGIIREEISMYDNNPSSRATFGFEYNFNIKDGHKYTISGAWDDIKNITSETLYRAYDIFYQPGNMFLVLTGKFKPLEALGILKEIESKYQALPFKKIIRAREKEPLRVANDVEINNMDVSIPKIKLGYKLAKGQFRDYNDTLIKIYLEAIMNCKFGSTSDTYERLTNENLVTYLDTVVDIRKDYIEILFSFESEYKDETISIIEENMENLTISKEDLNRVSRVLKSNFIMNFDDIVGVCESVQDDVIYNGDIIKDVLDIYSKINLKDALDIISLIDLSCECIYIVDVK